jgi:DNA-3-methyladenine glycosylase I
VAIGADGRARCAWCGSDPLYVAYHDDEWGRPEHDETRLFELLCLESFQSGLAWSTILRKREGFRRAFAGFAPEAVARLDDADVERLLADAAIVRHRGKIEAAIANARALQALHDAGETLDGLAHGHAPAQRVRSRLPTADGGLPAQTPESEALARALKARGFRVFGPTTAYAFMQAVGVVDDHVEGCFRAGA